MDSFHERDFIFWDEALFGMMCSLPDFAEATNPTYSISFFALIIEVVPILEQWPIVAINYDALITGKR